MADDTKAARTRHVEITVAIIGGIALIIATLIDHALSGYYAMRTQEAQTKLQQAETQEQENERKADNQTKIALKVLTTGNQQEAMNMLVFLADADLLPSPDKLMRARKMWVKAHHHNTAHRPSATDRSSDLGSRRIALTPLPIPLPNPRRLPPKKLASNAAPSSGEDTETVSSASPKFEWPVHGQVITPFGTLASGGRNDGINIDAEAGTPVQAAADGTVIYAGKELKGYGNMVLIRHQDGYVTAYAHLQNALVKREEAVRQGEEIGTVGDSGNVTKPQLHFELRHGVRPINPVPQLTSPKSDGKIHWITL